LDFDELLWWDFDGRTYYDRELTEPAGLVIVRAQNEVERGPSSGGGGAKARSSFRKGLDVGLLARRNPPI
jgi:hypothetical protein